MSDELARLKPRLRFVEAHPVEQEGEEPAVVIRDPEGLCDQMLAVPLPLFMVMTLFDGYRDLTEVRDTITQSAGGEMITIEQLGQIVGEMDQFFLLENERTAARRLQLEAEFDALPHRPAAHAGAAYPAEAEDCTAFFSDLFHGADGSGEGAHARGIVNPHIDFRVGGRCIAQGVASIGQDQPAALYVILGVAHQPSRNLYTLIDKPFETPLGMVETDRTAADRLRELYGAERLSGSLPHRGEHSIEFQAVALRYWHGDTSFKILPILCGALPEEAIEYATPPRNRAEVGEFIDALRRLIEEYDGHVCIIASVDLSHVGKKFGEEQGIDELRMASIRRADEAMLERVRAIDAEGFFQSINQDRNARNVDATAAVYTMLHVLGEGEAGEPCYRQWHEQETDSLVSFASLPIY